MSQSKFTWGQLKEFVNSLPEDQLSNEIIWWGDERGGKIFCPSAMRLFKWRMSLA